MPDLYESVIAHAVVLLFNCNMNKEITWFNFMNMPCVVKMNCKEMTGFITSNLEFYKNMAFVFYT